jgi:hypothetical protein
MAPIAGVLGVLSALSAKGAVELVVSTVAAAWVLTVAALVVACGSSYYRERHATSLPIKASVWAGLVGSPSPACPGSKGQPEVAVDLYVLNKELSLVLLGVERLTP